MGWVWVGSCRMGNHSIGIGMGYNYDIGMDCQSRMNLSIYVI